jgi:hypothetical protein
LPTIKERDRYYGTRSSCASRIALEVSKEFGLRESKVVV